MDKLPLMLISKILYVEIFYKMASVAMGQSANLLTVLLS